MFLRFFISRCDERICGGGWDTRINSALMGYLIANITHRTFKFEHLKPKTCDITKYIVPNRVNWSLPHSFHDDIYKEGKKDAKIVYTVDSYDWVVNLPKKNFTDPEFVPPSKKFVYYYGSSWVEAPWKKSLYSQQQLAWMDGLGVGEVKAALYKHLFKLTPYMKDKLKSILKKNVPTDKHTLVCAHVRTGRNPTNPHDTTRRIRLETVFRVWEALEEQVRGNPLSRVFLMSDNQAVLDDARNQSFADKLFSIDGPIVHLDRPADNQTAADKCEGLERLLIEQHLLMACDVMMMSHSGISHSAGDIRGSDLGLYCIYDNATVTKCRRRDFPNIFMTSEGRFAKDFDGGDS